MEALQNESAIDKQNTPLKSLKDRFFLNFQNIHKYVTKAHANKIQTPSQNNFSSQLFLNINDHCLTERAIQSKLLFSQPQLSIPQIKLDLQQISLQKIKKYKTQHEQSERKQTKLINFDELINKKKQLQIINIAQKLVKQIGRFELNQLIDCLSNSIQILGDLNLLGQTNLIRQKLNIVSDFILQTQSKIIIIFLLPKLAKIFKLLNLNYDSYYYFKHAKRKCTNIEDLHFKAKIYKQLSHLLSTVSYKYSLLYLTKYLQCAWITKNTKMELKAYDLLGLLFFNAGKLELANYLHQKMIENRIENPNSSIRKLGEKFFLDGSLGIFRPSQISHLNKIEIEQNDLKVSSDENEFEITVDHEFKEKIKKESREIKIISNKILHKRSYIIEQGNKNIHIKSTKSEKLETIGMTSQFLTHLSKNRNIFLHVKCKNDEFSIKMSMKNLKELKKELSLVIETMTSLMTKIRQSLF